MKNRGKKYMRSKGRIKIYIYIYTHNILYIEEVDMNKNSLHWVSIKLVYWKFYKMYFACDEEISSCDK